MIFFRTYKEITTKASTNRYFFRKNQENSEIKKILVCSKMFVVFLSGRRPLKFRLLKREKWACFVFRVRRKSIDGMKTLPREKRRKVSISRVRPSFPPRPRDIRASCVPLLPYLRVNHRNTSRPAFDSSGFPRTRCPDDPG